MLYCMWIDQKNAYWCYNEDHETVDYTSTIEEAEGLANIGCYDGLVIVE